MSFRTVSVLRVIAAESGLSNREVALRAGARDEGQISRLLKRLSGLGILETTRDSRIPGRTNAWRLTSLGVQLEAAVRDETPRPEQRVAVELPDLDAGRLDYRTPALLRSLAEEPGITTSQAAVRGGFADSAAASKLLSALAEAGLVRGAPSRGGRGEAWQLTAEGAELDQDLARSTPGRLRSRAVELMGESGGRLSDRAIAVLRVVGVEPGISNAGVAAQVGVGPEIDCSPYLAHLRERRLLENIGNAGDEAAWRLTPSGKRLHHALARETPAPSSGRVLDLMRASGARLNHRSAAILRLVARQPGLTNAQIAAGVGIDSPGHASKLLGHLAHRGLIVSAGTVGRRNAWHLTPSGKELGSAMTPADHLASPQETA